MDIHQLIAAINPGVYSAARERRQVKRILKEAVARGDVDCFLKAAAKISPVEPNLGVIEDLEQENPFRLPGFKAPIERHTVGYDNFDESLEAFYFWLLDDLTADGWEVSKLSDTFAATVGSGLYADLTRRETRAQQEATKMLRDAHGLIRDILRGVALLKEMNESIGNESEDPSLTSRYEIERQLLLSKFETLKLYARWLGPYLRQARQLEQRATGGAGLVHLFNTATADLVLLAQREYPVSDDVDRGELPRLFLKAQRREYFSVLIVELGLRAAPERNQPGGYGYRGRFDLTLTSFGLNQDELATLRREIEHDDLFEVMRTAGVGEDMTLNELVKAVQKVVAEPKPEITRPEDPNPFLALFDFKTASKEAMQDSENPVVRRDSDIEKVIRSQTILDARRRCLDWYGRIKSSLHMPSFR